MTVSNPSIPLLIQEQIPRSTVEASIGKPAMPAADAEARGLATSVGRGDEAAFRTLYDRYHQRLFRFALVLARGDESLAQDTVQSVFVTAAKKLRRADSEEHLWNWLARVARQQSARSWRTRRRDPAMADAEMLPENCPSAAQPDSFLEEVLDGALKMLETEDQQLIQVFYFDRLSQKQIAEQLGTTPKAVSSRLERAREKLRLLIKRKLSHET
jgi:RNA polymerase sigma-70 factor (ECF subfamily)